MATDQLFVREVTASGYRSLRAIRFPVGSLTVFVGPNGAGKRFAEALHRFGGAAARTVTKKDGATWIEGLMLSGAFRKGDEE